LCEEIGPHGLGYIQGADFLEMRGPRRVSGMREGVSEELREPAAFEFNAKALLVIIVKRF
jgi:hypothetical protein